jgi:protein-disulfide isomerase
MRHMKNPWVIIGLLIVILIGGSVWYSNSVGERNNEGVTFSPHLKGNPDAVVTLVEYSDLQCPACGAFQPYVNEIITAYGDAVRFEYKHFPLPIHPLAEPAARAAEAAGIQGQFFPFIDLVFENQTTWSKSPNPAAYFYDYATQLGLDVDQFKRHMNSSLVRDKVRADGVEAREKGITATPTFFLNGERMVISSYDDFRAQIEQAINPSVNFSADGSEVEAAPVESEVKFGI